MIEVTLGSPRQRSESQHTILGDQSKARAASKRLCRHDSIVISQKLDKLKLRVVIELKLRNKYNLARPNYELR